METQPIYTTSVRSDETGNWLQGVEGKLEPGVHRVVVEDEQGNRDEAMLFVVKEQPVVMERITKIFPEPFVYASSVLVALILGLVVANIWFGLKADRHQAARRSKTHRYLALSLALSVLVLVVTLAVGYVLNRDLGLVGRAKQAMLGVEQPMMDVRGAVITPFEHQGIDGVDLTVGDTSIRTVAGGRYVFSSVSAGSAIRLTHPEFKIAFTKRIDAPGEMDVVLDKDLYNLAFDIAQSEARGKIGQIYAKLTEVSKNSISEVDFSSAYQPLFKLGNIADQELRLGEITENTDWVSKDGSESYPQVISMEMLNGPQAKTYFFVLQDGSWRLVK